MIRTTDHFIIRYYASPKPRGVSFLWHSAFSRRVVRPLAFTVVAQHAHRLDDYDCKCRPDDIWLPPRLIMNCIVLVAVYTYVTRA